MEVMRKYPFSALATLLVVLMVSAQLSLAATFSDVSTSDPHYTAIEYLAAQGTIEGYSDGTFLPNQTINRAELMKILVAGQGIDPDADVYKECFPDVTTDWYAKYVCYAQTQGWVEGYPDGTFLPANEVLKVEAVKMLLNSHGFGDELPDEVTETVYTDIDITQWYAPYVWLAYQMNVLEEPSGDNYYPGVPIQRGAAAENLYRVRILVETDSEAFSEESAEELSADDDEVVLGENDFEPPSGISSDEMTGYGPWNSRIMLATSEDGLEFTKTYQIVTDQADVPDIVQDDQGWIYVYYTGWSLGEIDNQTAVAISDDNGESWTYKYLEYEGVVVEVSPVDPDITILEDGTFRLNATTSSDDSDPRTHQFESSDGVHFEYTGIAFEYDGKNVLDPSSLQIGDEWHFFAGGAEGNWHGVSNDGEEYEYYANDTFTIEGYEYMFSNGLAVEGGYRYFAFSNNTTDIYSFWTEDGFDWEADEGIRLELEEENGYEAEHVKDAAVVHLDDGSYLMVYMTGIPE